MPRFRISLPSAMLVLGIESSCDECSAAVVADGREILAQVIASQDDLHAPHRGVVPELASRRHTELIVPVVTACLARAGTSMDDIEGVAATARPGLSGSLLVGLSYAKGLALARGLPFLGVDHIRAHLYAPHLHFRDDPKPEPEPTYPYLGLLASGGHTVIARVDSFDSVQVLGTTVDDACGEAFDKVAKHLGLGYPGGAALDALAETGDPWAFDFPDPVLGAGHRPFDLSYSGLKTAVANQREKFRRPDAEDSPANVAASFRRVAISMLVSRVRGALNEQGLHTLAVGGGVAANRLLRRELSAATQAGSLRAHVPPFSLCTDNGAMIAGLANGYLDRGDRSPWSLDVSSRVPVFRAVGG